jgi:hypothetical protein
MLASGVVAIASLSIRVAFILLCVRNQSRKIMIILTYHHHDNKAMY